MRRDMVAGSALIVAGMLYAAWAVISLPLGTLNQMGPGMFPLGLGILLALFGAGIVGPAFIKDERIPQFNPRAFLVVLASLAAFALVIRPFGLFPAVIATAVVSSFAIPGPRPLTIAALCAVLMFLTWFIFIYLLALQIPLVQWRF
ncbi:MAG: tripartite tricarboxylate transporter TctB family protein [Pelagibacterium sp.]|uniref:tripartite tricarboxylate transporter TctB family protein n=1 Tax=Pelagibacterium sp. TaxID=1967288 RepID=UPI0032ECB937